VPCGLSAGEGPVQLAGGVERGLVTVVAGTLVLHGVVWWAASLTYVGAGCEAVLFDVAEYDEDEDEEGSQLDA
jgi:hypothetical protein